MSTDADMRYPSRTITVDQSTDQSGEIIHLTVADSDRFMLLTLSRVEWDYLVGGVA